MIRDIVRYGDPRLTAGNAEVDPAAEDLSGLVADMVATCHAAPGVGLAGLEVHDATSEGVENAQAHQIPFSFARRILRQVSSR